MRDVAPFIHRNARLTATLLSLYANMTKLTGIPEDMFDGVVANNDYATTFCRSFPIAITSNTSSSSS